MLALKGLGLLLSYALLVAIAKLYGAKGTGLYNLTTNAVNLCAIAALLGMDGWMLRSAAPHVSTKLFWYQVVKLLWIPTCVGILGLLVFAYWREGIMQSALVIGCIFLPIVMGYVLAVEGLASRRLSVKSEFIRTFWRPALILAGLFLIPTESIASPLWWAGLWTIVLLFAAWYFLFDGKKETTVLHVDLRVREIVGFWMMSLGGFALANLLGFFVEWHLGIEEAGVLTVLVRVAQLASLSLLAVQVVWGPEISQSMPGELITHKRKAILMGMGLALIIGLGLWFIHPWLFNFFGPSWEGVGPYFLWILVGQVAYSASAGWMVFALMKGGERHVGAGFLSLALLQVFLFATSKNSEMFAIIHGVTFILLALWNVFVGQRCTLES